MIQSEIFPCVHQMYSVHIMQLQILLEHLLLPKFSSETLFLLMYITARHIIARFMTNKLIGIQNNVLVGLVCNEYII